MPEVEKMGLTVFTIATNKYWSYFLNLLPNLRESIPLEYELEIIVLSNQQSEGLLETELANTKVRVFPAKHPDWPKVTLMRYQQILEYGQEISNPIVLWLDVDMQFVRPFPPSLLGKGIHFASHPGYVFSFGGFAKIKMGEKKDWLIEKLRLALSFQLSRGAWEENQESTAFVKAVRRKRYVHGAVWGGPTSQILNMCQQLAERVEADLENQFIATWHDESHLNWYHANYPQRLFSKHFSGANNHWTSNTKHSTIISLDKKDLDRMVGDS